MTYPFQVSVRPYTWRNLTTGRSTPTVRVQVGDHFVIIPIENARQVVDEIHDICDLHERQQRERQWLQP